MSLKRGALFIICISLVGMNFSPSATRAQTQPIVLTLAVENFMKDDLFDSNAGELLNSTTGVA